MINIFADRSLLDTKSFEIVDKHIHRHKHTKTYYVDIQKPDFLHLPFNVFSTDSIAVAKKDYDQVAIGHTKIELAYHMGALGFPWYESHKLTGLSPAQTSETSR